MGRKKKQINLSFCLLLFLCFELSGDTRWLALTFELGLYDNVCPIYLGPEDPQLLCAVLPPLVRGLWLAGDVVGGDAGWLVAPMAGMPAVVQEVVAVVV